MSDPQSTGDAQSAPDPQSAPNPQSTPDPQSTPEAPSAADPTPIDLPAPAPPESGSEVQAAAASDSERMLFTPPIDIYETDEGLVLLADLPGVSLETLELQVQDNKLTLFGRVSPSTLPSTFDPPAQLTHQEYHVGDFLRSFILSHDVDHDRITATLTAGVLKVTLPRTSTSKPRRIQVDAP